MNPNVNWKCLIATMAFTAMVAATGIYALTFSAIRLPIQGAMFLFMTGYIAISWLQGKQPENAWLYLRVFSLPGAGMLLLMAWLVSLARHHEIVSLLK